ncbi:MAG TPA: hypothetical protein VFR32_09080 [Gaiellaceae bacterium]|nr:hypothetical protein [Gaiellaceae bacterium]
MPRVRLIFPILLLCGAVAASTVLAGSELERPGVIRITNREISRKVVDLGDNGTSAGDQLIVTHLLFNRRITDRALGHDELLCTYLGRGEVLGGGSRSCTMTFFLPEGKLVVSGAVHNLLLFTLPVMGGTGIYDNVGGTLTATFLGSSPTRQLLLFRLTV